MLLLTVFIKSHTTQIIEISLQKPGKESQNVCICKSDSSLYFLLEKTSEDKLSN